jgi:hypothetical protein
LYKHLLSEQIWRSADILQFIFWNCSRKDVWRKVHHYHKFVKATLSGIMISLFPICYQNKQNVIIVQSKDHSFCICSHSLNRSTLIIILICIPKEPVYIECRTWRRLVIVWWYYVWQFFCFQSPFLFLVGLDTFYFVIDHHQQ